MADCFGHPLSGANAISQKPVGQPANVSSHSFAWGKTNNELTGIELPNPKLRVYSNGLGDNVCYPLDVPVEKRASGVLPDAKLYQRATRRPWDITMQQYCRQMNKRVASSMLMTGLMVSVIYPLWPTVCVVFVLLLFILPIN